MTGVVVSDKMQKTRVVAITHLQMNERYQKQVIKTTRLKAHDEQNQYHTGDKVVVQETRPLSREKRWRIINKA
ncbi:MAG: 30S ribosomal protein S17 [bacterium]|nr:30S ribosomal protein S17 [bacterium]